MSLRVVPCTLKRAVILCRHWHRHHAPPRGGLFALAADDGGRLVGVAIVGRPVARHLQDGFTAEVTRLATDGARNACSLLYAAAWRACRALGYRRLVTYVLASEPGTSLRASGWKDVAQVRREAWSRRSRPRVAGAPAERVRWEVIDPPPPLTLRGVA